jgi:hypothetical protein
VRPAVVIRSALGNQPRGGRRAHPPVTARRAVWGTLRTVYATRNTALGSPAGQSSGCAGGLAVSGALAVSKRRLPPCARSPGSTGQHDPQHATSQASPGALQGDQAMTESQDQDVPRPPASGHNRTQQEQTVPLFVGAKKVTVFGREVWVRAV